MKNAKNVIIALLLSLVVIDFIVIRDNNTLIGAYDRYNRDCEILLDSIAKWDETFGDGVAETDAYVIYIESREHLDSVLYNK